MTPLPPWPPAIKGLLAGSKDSNVAICTLWSQRELVAKMIDSSLYCIMGNLYSGGGINGLLRSILAYPSIRYVVLYGADLSSSGNDVASFFNSGVADGKVIGSAIAIEQELGDAYEDVRNNVTLVDMRKTSLPALQAKLVELNSTRLEPFAAPQEFPEAKQAVSSLESEQAGFLVRSKDISAAWLRILDTVMKFGAEKPSEYDMKQKEIVNLLAVVDERSKDTSLEIPPFIGFSEKEVQQYTATIFSAEKPDNVAYTYGQRIFGADGQYSMNQVELAIEKLKKNINTRRTIAFTWRPEDHLKSDSPPCLTQVSWLVQQNRLFQTVVFRSHDLFEGWPMNMYALRAMQEMVSEKVGVQCGPLTCLSMSAHIYENRWKDAKAILEKHLHASHAAFECDKRGVFHIASEEGEMVVTHLTADGQKTGFEFRGTDVHLLLDEVIQSNLISRVDHAAYLGRELQKLWTAMKLGKPYVQDRQMEL